MLNAKSTPTRYKGVLMRSKLETRWAAEFDRWDLDWEYEPQCPVRHYTPDFFLPVLGLWVEVKPTRRQAREGKGGKLVALAEVLAGAQDVVALYGEPGDFGCHLFLVPADKSGVWREYRWHDFMKARLAGRRREWKRPSSLPVEMEDGEEEFYAAEHSEEAE